MSISPSRHGSLPGSVAKSRGRVKFFTPGEDDDDPKAGGGGKAARLSRKNSLTNSQQQNITNNNGPQQQPEEDEFVPDIDYNDVLPLSLQFREEMQILMDEQEAYEEMKKKESLKTSVLASDGVASAVIVASPQSATAMILDEENEKRKARKEQLSQSMMGEDNEENEDDGNDPKTATSVVIKTHMTIDEERRIQEKAQKEYRNSLYSQFMDAHSFGYALPSALEKAVKDYQEHPSQKSKMSRRPVEFECSADITDEFHGEDMEDNVRDAILQERLAAQEMSYQATVSSTKAARWDLDKIFFLAAEDSSDDSEGGTEDIDSEWREETSQIYQTCRRVESSVQMRLYDTMDEDSSCDLDTRQRRLADMKMEQEKAATEFVDMIRSLHGYKCAPLLSAYCTELRQEQAMTKTEDINDDDDDASLSSSSSSSEDEEGQKQRQDHQDDDDDDNPYLLSKKKTKNNKNSKRKKRALARGNQSGNSAIISFSLSADGLRVKNKALETLEQNSITPSERAMIWDALRKVYQYAEPAHTKRWLSATSRLYEEPTFVDYQSVSTVSHIFFAAVRHLKEALQPRLHEKLKRWANRCLYLIQRRSLTLNEFGVTQPTYKAVNISCAGRSRDMPMENQRLPSILTLISDLHDHKLKEQKKARRVAEREEELRRMKNDFISNFIAVSSSNHFQNIRNRQAEKQEQLQKDAEEAWEVERLYLEENLMMIDDEDLFEDDSDDDFEDEEEEEQFQQQQHQQSARSFGNNSNDHHHQQDYYNATARSNAGSSGGGSQTREGSVAANNNVDNFDTQSVYAESIFTTNGVGAGSTYGRSRRDSLANSSNHHLHQQQQSSNVFASGDRLFFDFNERKRIEEERETKEKQMDPRKKRKEMRARRRAQMFAELKRSAMEERAQQELKEELMNFRETKFS